MNLMALILAILMVAMLVMFICCKPERAKRLFRILRFAVAGPAILLVGGIKPLDAISVPELLVYARNRKPRGRMGNLFFPAKDITGLDWKFIVGQNNLPVIAKIIAFNSQAPVVGRPGAAVKAGSIPPIKQKSVIDEETMKKLYEPRNNAELDEAIADIYDDVARRIEGVEARIELLQWDGILDGKVSITDEYGITQEADFGMNASTQTETLTLTARWDQHATATPIADMLRWKRTMEALTGVTLERSVTSGTVLAHILQCAEVQKLIHGANGTGQAVTEAQLQQLLQASGLPAVVTYDDQYTDEAADGTRTNARYLPEDKFVMLPGSKLGDQLYSPTVEALRKVRQNVINYGDARRIFVEVWEENEPPAHWTKAAALSFPTFPMVDCHFVADVY